MSWQVVNTEKTIETVKERNIVGQDPNDDFLFDESSIRARGKHIKAQHETFSSSFVLKDEDEISVSIYKQFYEDGSKVPKELLIGTASVVGKVIRNFIQSLCHLSLFLFLPSTRLLHALYALHTLYMLHTLHTLYICIYIYILHTRIHKLSFSLSLSYSRGR